MRASFLILLGLCLIAVCRSAEEDYVYDDEPAPAPVTQAPARSAGRLGSLLSSRARAPVGRKTTATSTTPKPAEQPIEEEFDDGEEIVDEDQEPAEEAPTTTTEATKKLRAGGVRPFRSNEDLLAALKRRRAEVVLHKKDTPTTQAPSDSTTVKAKSSGRRNSAVNESPTKSAARGRFNGSSRGKVPQEEVQETQQDEVQVKPKPYRRG